MAHPARPGALGRRRGRARSGDVDGDGAEAEERRVRREARKGMLSFAPLVLSRHLDVAGGSAGGCFTAGPRQRSQAAGAPGISEQGGGKAPGRELTDAPGWMSRRADFEGSGVRVDAGTWLKLHGRGVGAGGRARCGGWRRAGSRAKRARAAPLPPSAPSPFASTSPR